MTNLHRIAVAGVLALCTVAGAQAQANLAPCVSYPEVPAAAVADAGPFEVRAYHRQLFPDRALQVFPARPPMSVFHDELEYLFELGYNTIVYNLGHPRKSTITMYRDGRIEPIGCSTEDLRELVAHGIEAGLEPVFELKFVGKQLPLLDDLLKVHPGLVIDPKSPATVLNAAYRMPDGRSAYEATALALVDYLLDLYPEDHPAKYFCLGIDEFNVDDMATLAESLNMTPPQAFAHCLNLGTDHLLARGVTPVIWSDMLLSKDLATDRHGITVPGFVPDPRHANAPGGAYNSSYKRGSIYNQAHERSEVRAHTMVNHLRDRDKIVVADWHYTPSAIGVFPSVDYFQSVGFKDVWGCTWYDPVNLRQFSRYAALRGGGGMMATTWGMAYWVRQKLPFIQWSSSAYFRNPALVPPGAQPASYRLVGAQGRSEANARRTGIVHRDDQALTFCAPVPEPITPVNSVLLLVTDRGTAVEEIPLAFDPDKREVCATFTLSEKAAKEPHLQIFYGYADEETGFFIEKQCSQGVAVVDEAPDVPEAAPGVLLQADFRRLSPPKRPPAPWLGGEYAAPLGIAEGSAPRAGGLDSAWFDRVWIMSSDELDRVLCQGMQIEIEAKMTGGFAGNEFCALLTKGTFNIGFRVLVHQDRTLLFQLARATKDVPVWVQSKDPLPMNRWVNIVLTYRPPAAGTPGEATIQVDGLEQARETLEAAMPPTASAFGVGCEFKNPERNLLSKRRPNFPGLIRSLTIKALE